MSSLFQNMRSGGSYGIVPGNGNPKADDKQMNAGPGHVVPYENVESAKKIVSALGYNPNQKVSMNQGGGSGMDINISSKEYFLNQEQVDRMQNELGIDPEILSPNSDYNKRVDGGTTKQVKDMVDSKLYGLMMNNNNQYPAYQNGGGTEPEGTIIRDRNRPIYTSLDQFDFANYPGLDENRINDISGRLNSGAWGVDLSQYSEENPYYQTFKIGSSADPDFMPALKPKPVQPLPDDVFTNRNNYPDGRFPEYHELYDPEIDAIPEDPTDPRYTSEFGNKGPEEQALTDLMDRSQKLTRDEKLANVGMALWNMSREYEDLPEPIRIRPSATTKDYAGMQAEAEKALDKQVRQAQYVSKQLGASPVATTGITANQLESQNQISQSLWQMQQQDMNADRQKEDTYNSTWISQKLQRDMQNSAAKAAFAQDKGDKIAGNVREIYDSEEAGLYRDQGLLAEKSSMDMDAKYMDYKSLDKAKMMAGKDPNNPKSGYLSFSDYLKMTEEEQRQLGELYSI